MDCKEVCEKMFDYIEHQLSQEETKQFEEHMKECKYCQNEYYSLEKLIVKLKNIEDIEPSSDLKYKILDNIKKEQKQKPKILYFKKYSYVAATIAIFIGGFYILTAIENNPIKSELYNENNIEKYIQSNNENSTLENVQTFGQSTSEDIKEVQKSITNKIDEQSNSDDTIREESYNQEQTSLYSESTVQTTTNTENISTPRVTSQESDSQNESIQPFNSSRMLQKNIDNNYLYEKTLDENINLQLFKHDILLYKNQVCKVYFENKSNEDIILYVEDIDGNKVSKDTIVEKNSNNIMEFYIVDEDLEQGIYTVNVETLNKNIITGYLKVEVLQN